MADDCVSATTVVNAPAEAVFAVLADPTRHAAIDGTGWVRDAIDAKSLITAGQIFRMSMYHPGHPDGTYQMANRVQVFDPPNTTVTLTYDRSAVPDPIREHIGFPPFPPEHLGNSLAHLAEQVAELTADVRD